jgi:hypothetical protein
MTSFTEEKTSMYEVIVYKLVKERTASFAELKAARKAARK